MTRALAEARDIVIVHFATPDIRQRAVTTSHEKERRLGNDVPLIGEPDFDRPVGLVAGARREDYQEPHAAVPQVGHEGLLLRTEGTPRRRRTPTYHWAAGRTRPRPCRLCRSTLP